MWLDGKLEDWSDRLNPVFVKEMRQTVRSGSMLSQMLVSGLLVMGVLLFQLSRAGMSFSAGQPAGRVAFLILAHLLFLSCLIIIPVSAANRLLQERDVRQLELFYASPLTAEQIVNGKLAAGGYQALLLYSICAPFLLTTTLLRGVDLFSIVASLGVGLIMLIMGLVVVVFVGSLNVRRVVRSLIGIILSVIVGPVLLGMFGACATVLTMEGVSGLGHLLLSGGGVMMLFVSGSGALVLYGLAISNVRQVGGVYSSRSFMTDNSGSSVMEYRF